MGWFNSHYVSLSIARTNTFTSIQSAFFSSFDCASCTPHLHKLWIPNPFIVSHFLCDSVSSRLAYINSNTLTRSLIEIKPIYLIQLFVKRNRKTNHHIWLFLFVFIAFSHSCTCRYCVENERARTYRKAKSFLAFWTNHHGSCSLLVLIQMKWFFLSFLSRSGSSLKFPRHGTLFCMLCSCESLAWLCQRRKTLSNTKASHKHKHRPIKISFTKI